MRLDIVNGAVEAMLNRYEKATEGLEKDEKAAVASRLLTTLKGDIPLYSGAGRGGAQIVRPHPVAMGGSVMSKPSADTAASQDVPPEAAKTDVQGSGPGGLVDVSGGSAEAATGQSGDPQRQTEGGPFVSLPESQSELSPLQTRGND